MSKMAHSASASSKLSISPSYWMIFGFEENFDAAKSVQFLQDNIHIPFILGIGIYLTVLYYGQIIMASRQPIKAKKVLVLWNFGLAIFSIVGFSRVFPEFLHTFKNFGYEYTICNNSFLKVKPAGFWIYVFVLSKAPELVDTLFLVLRKQKLIFLHVYHHSTVLFFGWLVYADQVAAARWYCNMNFAVHSIMYTYYALKAFPNLIWIPKWVSMIITTLQTLQMVVGTYVVVTAAYIQLNGKPCDATTRVSIISLVIYVSYLFLFSHFFYKAYCCPAPPKSTRDLKKRA